MQNQIYLILDFETFSEADLKKVGAWEYAAHSSTEILCVAFRIGTRYSLRKCKTFIDLDLLKAHLHRKDLIFVAHNALFEQVICKHILGVDIKPERWVCTASLAASHALPRNLEGACLALGLSAQKDMEGRRLMLKHSKPRKPTMYDSSTRHDDENERARILEYCKKDIEAETELFLRLPELSQFEKQIWNLDQKINMRGFAVDRPLVNKVLEMVDEESKTLLREAVNIANGEIQSPAQRDAVLRWLRSRGMNLPDLRAKTVADTLALGQGDAKCLRMLKIRQSVSKTSTAKYSAFESRSRSDGRVRDILVYHSASTGRWGGAGVQPQNFPRGKIKNTDEAAEVLMDGDVDFVRSIYGEPMDVFSSCLRSMITASEGKSLFCADYAAIEARVLFWIADHEEGLKAFRDNIDLYLQMASRIYGRVIEKEDKLSRQLGKTAILGLGYQMGAKKFLETCKQQNILVSADLASIAVKAYRKTHEPVTQAWHNLEQIAILAVKNPHKRYGINHTKWFVKGNFLYCELPSGRRIAYYGPQIKSEENKWGGEEKRDVLYHWGVNSMTKRWELSGTYGGRLTENIVQAIARDLMADAMLRIEKAGFDIVLSVHDELVAESTKGEIEHFNNLMAEAPSWAKGCPIKVEGWKGTRYRK